MIFCRSCGAPSGWVEDDHVAIERTCLCNGANGDFWTTPRSTVEELEQEVAVALAHRNRLYDEVRAMTVETRYNADPALITSVRKAEDRLAELRANLETAKALAES